MDLKQTFKNIHWKNLITAVAIPLWAGFFRLGQEKGMKAFEVIAQPPLTYRPWRGSSRWYGAILFCPHGHRLPISSRHAKKARHEKPSPQPCRYS